MVSLKSPRHRSFSVGYAASPYLKTRKKSRKKMSRKKEVADFPENWLSALTKATVHGFLLLILSLKKQGHLQRKGKVRRGSGLPKDTVQECSSTRKT